MFIVRPPSILRTPTAVAHDLGARTRFYPNPRHPRVYDFNRDFLMVPVNPREVRNAPADYVHTFAFAQRNKYGQRRALEAAGIPVPRVAQSEAEAAGLAGSQFVVRPLRHARSAHYRVTQDRLDFSPGTEYISELYPKRREYRVVFVFGNPLIVLRKKPNEGVTEAEPWGHVNSRFQTINDVPGSRLSQTDALQRLASFPVIQAAHIVAADLLYNNRHEKPWVCLELNFCPALDIDNNRAQVVSAIQGRR